MPDVDLFHFFRLGVAWIATVYATVVTVQSLYGWYVYLAASDRYTNLMRRYLIAQAVRMRIMTFGGELLVCLLLCVLFVIIWRAHHVIYGLEETLRDNQRFSKTH